MEDGFLKVECVAGPKQAITILSIATSKITGFTRTITKAARQTNDAYRYAIVGGTIGLLAAFAVLARIWNTPKFDVGRAAIVFLLTAAVPAGISYVCGLLKGEGPPEEAVEFHLSDAQGDFLQFQVGLPNEESVFRDLKAAGLSLQRKDHPGEMGMPPPTPETEREISVQPKPPQDSRQPDLPRADGRAGTVANRTIDPTEEERRIEEFYTLTGGAEPEEKFRTLRTLYAVGANSSTAQFADLLFTNVGILVRPFGSFPCQGKAGGALAGIFGGLQAGAVFALVESSQVRAAQKDYNLRAPHERDFTPKQRFLSGGAFIPADEIEAPVLAAQGVVSFQFRGKMHIFGFTLPFVEFEKWLAPAAKERKTLSGGPPNPGPHTLFVWAQRPKGPIPEWVNQLVNRLASQEDYRVQTDTHLLQRLRGLGTSLAAGFRTSAKEDAQLLHRLKELGTAESARLAQRLASKGLRENKTLVAVGGFLLLTCGTIVVERFLHGERALESSMSVIAIVFSVTGVVCGTVLLWIGIPKWAAISKVWRNR